MNHGRWRCYGRHACLLQGGARLWGDLMYCRKAMELSEPFVGPRFCQEDKMELRKRHHSQVQPDCPRVRRIHVNTLYIWFCYGLFWHGVPPQISSGSSWFMTVNHGWSHENCHFYGIYGIRYTQFLDSSLQDISRRSLAPAMASIRSQLQKMPSKLNMDRCTGNGWGFAGFDHHLSQTQSLMIIGALGFP